MEKLIQSGLLLSFSFGIICLIAYGIQCWIKKVKHKEALKAFYEKMLSDIESAEVRLSDVRYMEPWLEYNYLAKDEKFNSIENVKVDPKGRSLVLIDATDKCNPVVWFTDGEWRFKLESFTYINKEHPYGLYQWINSEWKSCKLADAICLSNLSGRQHMDLVRALFQRAWPTLVKRTKAGNLGKKLCGNEI